MSSIRWAVPVAICLILGVGSRARAGDLKITLPRRSHMTPVQRLNREGVEAVRKHHYEKAEAIFYKAYLFDPDDPFTLNNLGYIAELQGQVDRAQKFYSLAAKQASDATIDLASADLPGSSSVNADRKHSHLRGRSIGEISFSEASLQRNHQNVEAVRLLSQGRAEEVEPLLQQVLKSDPHNPFALNNMGVTKEMEGDSDQALKYYDAAAASSSSATAVITYNRSWRGKPVNEIAGQNARNLRARLQNQNVDARLAELNFRGVAAINANDLKTAEAEFRQAYALDPNNAFALNNIGYLAELEGDRETAQFFYDKARTAAGADSAVGLATRRSAEGQRLFQVASDSDSRVEAKVVQEQNALRQRPEPIILRHRDNTLVDESSPPTPAAPRQDQPPKPPQTPPGEQQQIQPQQ